MTTNEFELIRELSELKAENKALKDINEKLMQALRIHNVVGQSEQLYDRCSCDKLFEQASKIDIDNENEQR